MNSKLKLAGDPLDADAASGATLRAAAALLLRMADSMDGHGYVHDLPLHSPKCDQDQLVLRIWAEAEHSSRKARRNFLPAHLFGEPAWDILLELYISESRQQTRDVATVGSALGRSEPTAIRWIEILTRDGLVETMPAEFEEQQTVRLTKDGMLAVSRWLRHRAALPS